MKSKQEQLESRGYLSEEFEPEFENISLNEKVKLLESKIAVERTLGARLLQSNPTKQTVEYLLEALQKEKKLYAKIEICNTLSELGEIAISPLINNLAKIGKNQHQSVPEKDFKKDSYPLPRDIVSRTLIRIGTKAIPKLLKELETANESVLSELSDTIGHINLQSKIEGIYEFLKRCYDKNTTNDLIKWKIIRALSGIKESEKFLNNQYILLENKRLKSEINRSLRILKKGN
jgi:HEAT repeat protein